MKLPRREFLRLASASPFVFGLNELLGQTQEPPAWWKEALARMKDRAQPGLVFISEEFAEERKKLGWAIRDLLENDDARAREIFCASVVVCLRPEIARACLGAAAAPGRVLVLDPSGHLLEKFDLRLEDLKDPSIFEERFSKRLYGEGEVRLAAAANRIRSTLLPEEKKAFEDLSAESVADRDRASAILLGAFNTLAWLVLYERRKAADGEKDARIRRIIDAHFEAADEKTPGPRLPFGARFEAAVTCAPEEEGVPSQCGMGRLEGKGQRFLEFLEK